MSTIKPGQILQVLDTARAIRAIGGDYVPCFAGDSGIGKSQVTQQWAKAQGKDFGFIDLRLAYMEGPDMIGMPQSVMVDGKYTTIHSLPDFLPRGGSGLLLVEEPNRAHESVMQTIMQILTDRKIHGYTLPEGWIIAAAINPEGKYNVNSMDAAVKNRFQIFDVKFDHNSFVTYMKETGYNSQLIAFMDSGLWTYKAVEEIGDEGVYISSRSFQKLNDLLKVVSVNSPMFFELTAAILGKVVAADFVKYVNEIRPVLFEDFQRDEKGAFVRLKKITKTKDYAGDLISVTVSSIADAYKADKCDDVLVLKVSKIIDLDHAVNLACLAFANKPTEYLQEMKKKNAKLWADLAKRKDGKEEKVA